MYSAPYVWLLPRAPAHLLTPFPAYTVQLFWTISSPVGRAKGFLVSITLFMLLQLPKHPSPIASCDYHLTFNPSYLSAFIEELWAISVTPCSCYSLIWGPLNLLSNSIYISQNLPHYVEIICKLTYRLSRLSSPPLSGQLASIHLCMHGIRHMLGTWQTFYIC